MDKDLRRRDLIQEENAKPGTTDWFYERGRPEQIRLPGSKLLSGQVRAETRSSSRSADLIRFILDIYRMGYYGGRARVVWGWVRPRSVQAESVWGERLRGASGRRRRK